MTMQSELVFTDLCSTLMNPLMILVKIIKLKWIHILSYDQMVSRKINNQTTRCANSIFYTTLFTNSARITLKTTQQLNVGLPRLT
jgi:hypothetical protein